MIYYQNIFLSLFFIGLLTNCQTTNKKQEETPSLSKLTQNIRPDFLIGSHSNGLDFRREDSEKFTDFFAHNFNIMTVGIYMQSNQPVSNKIVYKKTDDLIDFATSNNLKVYLHPMFGGGNYIAPWVQQGTFTNEQLRKIMRDRVTGILTRYKGKIDYVDVSNEPLIGKGTKENGEINWQIEDHKGRKNVWMQLGMYKGEKHEIPQYLVDAFRLCREIGGPDVKLILNEWGNETTTSNRAEVFLQIVNNMREEGIPIDAAGMQLHLVVKNGTVYGWEQSKAFDFDAFEAKLAKYEEAGIEIHITEFDIHLESNPTIADYELQGKYYAEVLKRAIKSPAVKSFKTWGFTDAYSWKANGKNGHPLMLDENVLPKPAYTNMVEMLKTLN